MDHPVYYIRTCHNTCNTEKIILKMDSIIIIITIHYVLRVVNNNNNKNKASQRRRKKNYTKKVYTTKDKLI